MNRTALRIISLLAILALFSVWAFGQAETGQITGTIKDASGAVVSGAKVTAKSVNTGLDARLDYQFFRYLHHSESPARYL